MAERVYYLSLTYEESLQIKKKKKKEKDQQLNEVRWEIQPESLQKNIYIYIANSFETLGGKMLNLN